MQFKWLISKRETLFLVQWILVGDDIKDTMAPPYATMLEEFVEHDRNHLLGQFIG